MALVETACLHLLEKASQDQWELLVKGEEHKPLCANLPMSVDDPWKVISHSECSVSI